MTDRADGPVADLAQVLRAVVADPGCAVGAQIMEQYVQHELDGVDPGRRFPGIQAHLRSCRACRDDHDGLLEAAAAHEAPLHGAPVRRAAAEPHIR